MRREHLAFLFCGFAFGILVGFGLFNATEKQPDLGATAVVGSAPTGPMGPVAPTQRVDSAGGGAPMMVEINRLKGVLQENPKEFRTLARLGGIYHEAGMWEQAAGYYERAIAEQPDNPDLITDLAVCYRGMQQYDLSLKTFDQAHGIEPAHWQSMFNKAIVAFEIGRVELAIEAVDIIESIEPRPADLDPSRLIELRGLLEKARDAPDASS